MPERAQTLDLDAIEQRANAATEGPWTAATDTGRKTAVAVVGAERDRGTGRAIAVFAGTDGKRHADAELAAHARTDIPELIARVRELEAAAAEPVRVWVVLDTTRLNRVHGVTCDLLEAQRWTRELVAKHGGDNLTATMTVGLVTPGGRTRDEEAP